MKGENQKMSGWRRLPFDEVVADESGGNLKTPKSEFLPAGEFAVVDQGKELVAGYVNEDSRICRSPLPVVVFGDHTRCLKFIDFPFCMGADGIKVLRPKIDADVKYLFHFLRQLHLPDGGYDRHFKYLKRSEVILPPLAEQRRIAEVLDKAEALRAKRCAALAKLNSLTQSLFLDLFGDPVFNERKWPRLPLSGVCRSPDHIKCGPFGTQLARDEFRTEGVPLWGIKNVNKLFELPTHEFLEPRTAKRLIQYSIEPGDIVMTRKGTVGNCAVYPSNLPPGIMHSDLLRLRVNHETCDPIYLSHQLHYSRDVEGQLALISGGAVMPGINVTRLKNLEVLLPPIDLQREFARRVAAVEKLKTAQRAALAELDALFASLQHRAFRGELFG